MSTPKKGLIAEFKEFLATGDLMTIAVAFIMGAAVKAVIDSFVKDIVTGIIGLFVKCKDIIGADGKPTGEQNCSGLAGKAYKSVGWGNFINNVIQFIIIGFVVFMLVKAYKKMTNRNLSTAGPTPDQVLLTEIRDALKK
jgi:large conductance mechanosensitive channel